MTTGAVLFAYNTEQIDYVKIAEWTAKNIRRHLGIPVALITDRETDRNFDQVIVYESTEENFRWFGDLKQQVPWKNDTRPMAYDLSPWDRTLVLDVDYVVASDQLKTILECDRDFLSHRYAYDITGQNDFKDLNHFGGVCMPMWWATVMVFNKTQQAKLIFDSMKMVRDNWTHYKILYQNTSPSYRNDHALSIALGIVDGHVVDHDDIPWSLASLVPEHQLSRVDRDHYRVDFVDTENKKRWMEIRNQDFHAMGKTHLEALIENNT